MKNSYSFFFLGFLSIFLGACSVEKKSPETIFPAEKWEVNTPESQNINSQKLEDALNELRSFSGKDGTTQTVIIRNGYMIYQGDSTHKSHNIWSSTKSFTSTILGLLIEQGKCKLDDPAYKWEPLLDTEEYRGITLRHFTTMTSGYNAVGRSRWNEDSEDWSWTPYEPGKPIFLPGENYCYWDEAMMMFGRTLTQIAGESLADFLDKNIGQKIGLGEFKWGPEGELNGIPLNNGCTNLELTPLQLARFGWLILNKGNWNGKQIVNEAWAKEATKVQVPLSTKTADTDRKSANGSGGYGYNWWINGGNVSMPDSPKSLFYASGFNNNMCFVIPEWNMVVVRMGIDSNPEIPKYQAYNQFFKKLTQAIKD